MKNEGNAFAGPRYSVGIAQIAFDKLEPAGEMLKVFAFPGLEIVEATDCFSAFDQGLCDPGADEAGAASDEVANHDFQSYRKPMASPDRSCILKNCGNAAAIPPRAVFSNASVGIPGPRTLVRLQNRGRTDRRSVADRRNVC